MILFTIVIPTYNNKTQLEKCLLSILKIRSKDYRAIVCDNGSQDGTVEFLADFISLHPQFILVEHADKQNKGRAANRNQALPYIDTPFVLFLDSDTIVREEILSEHINVLNSNKNAVSLGGTHYSNATTNDWAAYLGKRGPGKFNSLQSVDYKYFNTQNSAMPSHFFRELGGFDPKMFFYGGDDIEFACRLAKKYQPRFIINTKASVYAEMDKTLGKALEQFEEFGRVNLKYIVKKHPDCEDIFHVHLFLRNNIKAFLFRLLFNDGLGWVFLRVLHICPSVLKFHLINYLVALSIKKGMLSADIHEHLAKD